MSFLVVVFEGKYFDRVEGFDNEAQAVGFCRGFEGNKRDISVFTEKEFYEEEIPEANMTGWEYSRNKEQYSVAFAALVDASRG